MLVLLFTGAPKFVIMIMKCRVTSFQLLAPVVITCCILASGPLQFSLLEQVQVRGPVPCSPGALNVPHAGKEVV